MYQKYISIFSFLCNYASIPGSIMFLWDPKHQKLFVPGDFQQSEKRMNIKCLLHTTATISYVIGGTYHFLVESSNDIKWIDVFLFANGFINIGWGTFCLNALRKHVNEICSFVNSLEFELDTSIIYTKTTVLEYIVLLYCKQMPLSGITIPFAFIYGFHYFQPCRPSISGYFLIPECLSVDNSLAYFGTIGAKLGKLLVFLWNHWAWTTGLHAGTFVYCGLLVVGSLSLRTDLKL